MSRGRDASEPQRVSILHKGLVLKGELTGKGHLTISGCVDGGINLKGGKLIITQTGYVEGNVQATQVHIDGEVRGNVSVRKKAFIGSTARVLGDINSKTLDIAEGAKCNGFLQIGEYIEEQHQAKIQEM